MLSGARCRSSLGRPRARFEFRIHARTLEAPKANAQGLAQLSAERVRDEWLKGLTTATRMSKLVKLWRDVSATRIRLPKISGTENREEEELEDPSRNTRE